MSTILDSYVASNGDNVTSIGIAAGYTARGQTFTGDGSYIESVDFDLYQASANGTFTAKIYAHDGGTFGTSGLPTGAALATSVSRPASGITSGAHVLTRFWFVGANQFKTVNTTKYVVVAEVTGESGGNTYFAIDTSSSTHAGNAVYYNGSAWVTSANDTIFYLRGVSSPNSGFTYKKSITIDHTKCGSADSKNYPVKISLGSNVQSADNDLKLVGSGGYVVSGSGYDIRPYSDAALTQPLDYELTYYNSSSGALEMDVRIPTLSVSSDTVIYLAFGNSSLTSDSSFTGVWDGDFLGVYHLGDGSTINLGDSTNNAYSLTNNNSATATAGQTGGAVNFSAASSQYLSNGSLPLASGSALTMSLWIYSPSANQGSQLSAFNIGNQDSPNRVLLLMPWNSGTFYFDYGNDTGGRVSFSFAGYYDAWVHVTAIYNTSGNDHRVYLNASSMINNADSTTASSNVTGIYMGGWPGVSQYWYGKMDEVKVSKVARSSSWITADYNAQKASSTLITWGSKVAGDKILPNKFVRNSNHPSLNRSSSY